MEKTLTESEKIEQLMRPRYKVIADYPGASFIVGTVLDPDVAVHYVMNDEELNYEKYPHLFKRLEWWQERSIEEMPEYVKWVLWNEPQIEKVNSWRLHGKIPYADVPSQVNSVRAEYFEPATEQEYLTHSQAGER